MKKYYLEVIGGTNPNQLYVVNADELSFDKDNIYCFRVNGKPVAMYPISRTVIKSVEVMDK